MENFVLFQIRYQYELHVKEAEKLKNAKQAELLAVEN